jgi:hypothetical protein
LKWRLQYRRIAREAALASVGSSAVSVVESVWLAR